MSNKKSRIFKIHLIFMILIHAIKNQDKHHHKANINIGRKTARVYILIKEVAQFRLASMALANDVHASREK